MAERRIRITLDPSSVRLGSDQARQSLNRLQREASQTRQELRGIVLTDARGNIVRPARAATQEVNKLKTAAAETSGRVAGIGRGLIGLAAAGFVVSRLARQAVEYADAWTLTENRLRIVTTSHAELLQVQQQVLEVANSTRSEYVATVDLYSRLARSLGEYNIEQSRVLAATVAINQAVRVGGSTAPRLQPESFSLGRVWRRGRCGAMNCGRFWSKCPAWPLRWLAGWALASASCAGSVKQGQLTTTRVLQALEQEAPSIETEFRQLNSTVGESLTVFGNQLLSFTGRVDQAIGATGALTESIRFWGVVLGEITPQATVVERSLEELQGSIRSVQEQIAVRQSFVDAFPNLERGVLRAQIESLGELRQELALLEIQRDRAQTSSAIAADTRTPAQVRQIGSLVARYRQLDAQLGRTRGEYDLLRASQLGASETQLNEIRAVQGRIDAYQAAQRASLAFLTQINAENAAIVAQERLLEQAEGADSSGLSPAQRLTEDLQGLFELPVNAELEQWRTRFRDLAVTVGSTSDQVDIYRFTLAGATEADLIAARAAQELRRTYEEKREELRELEQQERQTEQETRRFADTLSGSFNSALESAIFAGKGFGEVVRSLGEDLARLIIRITIFRPLAESLAAIFSQGSGGGGGGGGGFLQTIIGAVTGALSGIGGGGGATPSGRGFVGSFQRGGAFVVPGTGGPDSRQVSFNATPGERVTVSPASAQPRITINNYAGPDTSVETQTRSGPSGEQVVEVIVRKSLDRMSRTGELGKILGQFGVRPT